MRVKLFGLITLLSIVPAVRAMADDSAARVDTVYEFPPVVIVGKAIVDQTTIER